MADPEEDRARGRADRIEWQGPAGDQSDDAERRIEESLRQGGSKT